VVGGISVARSNHSPQDNAPVTTNTTSCDMFESYPCRKVYSDQSVGLFVVVVESVDRSEAEDGVRSALQICEDKALVNYHVSVY
jgi:hypothetical protein